MVTQVEWVPRKSTQAGATSEQWSHPAQPNTYRSCTRCKLQSFQQCYTHQTCRGAMMPKVKLSLESSSENKCWESECFQRRITKTVKTQRNQQSVNSLSLQEVKILYINRKMWHFNKYCWKLLPCSVLQDLHQQLAFLTFLKVADPSKSWTSSSKNGEWPETRENNSCKGGAMLRTVCAVWTDGWKWWATVWNDTQSFIHLTDFMKWLQLSVKSLKVILI